MEPRYSKVQCKPTIKNGDTQYDQHFACIPQDIYTHLGLRTSLFLKWTPNDDGTVTITKSQSKPTSKKMTYAEWLARIEPHIPTEPPGKNPFEIYKETGIAKKSISPICVDRARREINLQSHHDSRTHKTFWYRLPVVSPKPRKMIDVTLTQLT